jgi:hypothetical protein
VNIDQTFGLSQNMENGRTHQDWCVHSVTYVVHSQTVPWYDEVMVHSGFE